jgi:hypothetical protein
VSNGLTVDALKKLIQTMPPRAPNTIRINQRTLDVLSPHVGPTNDNPLASIRIEVSEYMPDGVIAFGWRAPGGNFELNHIAVITDQQQEAQP